MSSLIFITDSGQAFVATDTLATLYDGTPFMFTTKVFVVPHLRMIMCGTGIGGFLGKWFIQINDGMVVRDIDHLNYHTPNNLRAFWQAYKQEFSVPDHLSTTVYYFGFSEEDGQIHSYAYRSKSEFNSETVPYGIGVKPKCQIPEDYEFPKDVKKMMHEQRATQASLPKNERLHIGGEIVIHHLMKLSPLGQPGFSIYTLGKFEDFEANERTIYENFPNIGSSHSEE